MEYIIPTINWVTAIADAIGRAQEGDIIIVSSILQKELAERAMARMNKTIPIEVKEE